MSVFMMFEIINTAIGVEGDNYIASMRGSHGSTYSVLV